MTLYSYATSALICTSHISRKIAYILKLILDGCLPSAHRMWKDVKTCLYSSTLSIIQFYSKVRTYTDRLQYAIAEVAPSKL